ncbi:hypothetical protein A0O28_0040200 [Trichoderma guizhouense]|uniref:Uncharacterized protein n=1 Tax=Trichoderma guizhouense TaxID=1491466 RepID=A0A1T3C7P7_9HYPO|nr:hypothetical protein A0O28_0040200 [Trichoderma guizhouense]
MPRQAAPRMAQASLPPNMMHQNSQVGSQMTMNDLIIENRTSLQDSETQAMPLQIQRHQHQQIATTLQNSGQQEGQGNGTVPELKPTTVDMLFNNVKFGWDNDNERFNDEFNILINLEPLEEWKRFGR